MNKVFLIDISGAIHHTEDDLARVLFRNLYPGDNFEVIYFDHATWSVFSDLVPFGNGNVHHAISFLSTDVVGGGGTLLSEPLERARMLINGDELGQIIILSDGYWAI